MKKFPDVPSTLDILISADKKENHLTDVQEVIRINKYIVDPNKKLQFKIDSYGHKVIPSAYSDWISHNKKRNRRPVDGTQRHAITIMLNVEYIETIFSNGLEIIPFMAQTFDFARKKLPKPSDKSISKKVIALNNETLKLFLASKNLEKVGKLCDTIYTFSKRRNEYLFVKYGHYNENFIISVSTWLDANYSNSIGTGSFLSKEKANKLNKRNYHIPHNYSFKKISMSKINNFYIGYDFIYEALSMSIIQTEAILLNLIDSENNIYNKNSQKYKEFSVLTYESIYNQLGKTINKLNSIALRDAEFIFNSTIDLICSILNKLVEIMEVPIYNYYKQRSMKVHSYQLSSDKIKTAKELYKSVPSELEKYINATLKRLLS